MTMDPGKRALVDQATASASWFIDEILAEMVTLIGRGMPHVGVIEQIGGGMALHQLNDTQVLVVAAVATARLARLHHAIEQLAQEWIETATRVADRAESALKHGNDESATRMDAEAIQVRACAAKLRKLVETHG